MDFRTRLAHRAGANTINKVIETLKVLLREATLREDLDRDPSTGIGSIRYERQEVGTFTKA